MLATVASAIVEGVDGHAVTVEVHVSRGLPGYTLVGMPDASCRESRDRVRAALLSSGFKWPDARITVNLAPTGVRKQGAILDLPIALGLLAASNQIPLECLERWGAVGELGLDGSIRRVAGLVCLAGAIKSDRIIVPRLGSPEAALVRPGDVFEAANLRSLVEALTGEGGELTQVPMPPHSITSSVADLSDVRGQPMARWALEVAAAGGHHLLLVGPPGSGKTMLAERLVGLLPTLERDEALESTRIHSAAGLVLPPGGLVRRPPLRAPHHGASMVAIIGGGTSAMRPGEISCAHNGVLFLDELGEFPPSVLDSLRQPLEQGQVRVSRAARSLTLPAQFLLVAAMNPCPCGEGGFDGACRCSAASRARYTRRLSGPLLDRFDIRVEVRPPAAATLLDETPEESSIDVAARVGNVRQRALARGVPANAALNGERLNDAAALTDAARDLVRHCLENGTLTGRGLTRVRRVARTIADLGDYDDGPLDDEVIASALSLRSVPSSILGNVAVSS